MSFTKVVARKRVTNLAALIEALVEMSAEHTARTNMTDTEVGFIAGGCTIALHETTLQDGSKVCDLGIFCGEA